MRGLPGKTVMQKLQLYGGKTSQQCSKENNFQKLCYRIPQSCQLPVLKIWLCVSTSHVDITPPRTRREIVVWNISGVASLRSLRGRRQQKEIS